MTDPDATRAGKRRRIHRLVAALLATLLALAGAEGVVRIAGIGPPRLFTKRALLSPTAEYHCYPTNPNGEFVPTPEVESEEWKLITYVVPPAELPLSRLEETPWCVEYRHSSLGFRDREYPPRPEEGVLRIAGVGDSFTYGEGVQSSRTWPRRLEALLGAGYEVVNAGRSNADLHAEVRTVRELAENHGCRRAVVAYVVNDVRLTEELDRRQSYINDLINIRDEHFAADQRDAWWSGKLRILDLVGSALAMRRISRDTVQWYRDSYDEQRNGENLERLREDFRDLASLTDCYVAVAVYPLMVDLEDYPLADVHARVAAMAREAGLIAFDLAPVFRDRKAEELQVHPTDHHPNAKAHEMAAHAILSRLREDHPWFLRPLRKYDPARPGGRRPPLPGEDR